MLYSVFSVFGKGYRLGVDETTVAVTTASLTVAKLPEVLEKVVWGEFCIRDLD